MAVKKFSEWLGTDLPPLPEGQFLPDDSVIVIRAGVPYELNPLLRIAEASEDDNPLSTTINTVDVWESVNATMSANPGGNQGFSFAANVFTHTEVDMAFPIKLEAVCTFLKDGGGNPVNYQVGIFVNGVLKTTGGTDSASNTQFANGVCLGSAIIANGDTIELKVRNRSDSVNVMVQDLFIRIG